MSDPLSQSQHDQFMAAVAMLTDERDALKAEVDRLNIVIDEKDYEIKNLRKFAPSHPHDIGQPAVGFGNTGWVSPVFDREGAHLVISVDDAMTTINECQEP